MGPFALTRMGSPGELQLPDAPKGGAHRHADRYGAPSFSRGVLAHVMALRERGSRLVRWGRRHPLWMGMIAGALLLAAVDVVRSLRGAEVDALRVTLRAPRPPHRRERAGVSSRRRCPWPVCSRGRWSPWRSRRARRWSRASCCSKLESATLEAEVARARAGVLQARARLKQLLEVSAPQRAQAVRQAELERDQAERAFERARKLRPRPAPSRRSSSSRPSSAREVARSRLASAQAQATASSPGRGRAPPRRGRGGAGRGRAEGRPGAPRARPR